MYTPPLEVLLVLNKSEISPEFIMNVDFFFTSLCIKYANSLTVCTNTVHIHFIVGAGNIHQFIQYMDTCLIFDCIQYIDYNK